MTERFDVPEPAIQLIENSQHAGRLSKPATRRQQQTNVIVETARWHAAQ